MTVIVKNKKAFFDYEILDSIEAGIVLNGDEVKSLRAGKVSLSGAFATIHDHEIFMINCNITSYSHAYIKSEDKSSVRRKLLLHRKEIDRIAGDVSRKGVTLVILKLYFKNGKVKAEVGICKHKKAASKKSALRDRDIERETTRELRGKYKF